MGLVQRLFLIGAAAALHVTGIAAALDETLRPVFAELRSLKPMEFGQNYTVTVAGHAETGPKEEFLRRRTAREVSESGLSCGCGDYALLFIERIEPLGFKTLLVDGAEVSSASLQNQFSGHAVVAIRAIDAPDSSAWTLVDSTNLRVISRNWSPSERSFHAFGRLFWIGYCGARSDYPVSGPAALKTFYTRTLATVPLDVYERNLIRLKFTVDRSLIGEDGKYLNPRLESFLSLQDDILKSHKISPQREVAIRLVKGNDDYHSGLAYSQTDGWLSELGLKSGCSSSLLAYYEDMVHRRDDVSAAN